MNREFNSELELSDYIAKIIEKTINEMNLKIYYKLEVSTPGCIPDMVLVEERDHSIHYLIAIEFKLSNWQRAIYQAFRYRNFGNESYVILDRKRANPAIKHLDMFKRANIGLLTVENSGNLFSWFMPKPGLPFSKEFSYHVACSVMTPEKPTIEDLLFTTDFSKELSVSQLKTIWT